MILLLTDLTAIEITLVAHHLPPGETLAFILRRVKHSGLEASLVFRGLGFWVLGSWFRVYGS